MYSGDLSGQGKACAKFILVGEHFIVDGDTGAVAVPLLSLYTQVELKKCGEKLLQCLSFNELKERSLEVEAMMPAILRQALMVAKIQQSPECFTVNSNFPIGRGFGSSASLSVAIARALMSWQKGLSDHQNDSHKLIIFDQVVSVLEKYFHGNPSGVDAAVIATEKPIFFRRNQPTLELEPCAVDFVLLDGGQRNQCKELVHKVSILRKDQPKLWQQFELQMESIVKEVVANFSTTGNLAKCIDENHKILQQLQLSTPMIDDIIYAGKKSGALAGKVSGAGAGGAVVLLVRKGEAQYLAESMQRQGYQVVTHTQSHLLSRTTLSTTSHSTQEYSSTRRHMQGDFNHGKN